jgi:hydroxymethylglutaryl-CoA lyase
MRLPESVSHIEVLPRDGLQSVDRVYDLETKVRLVEILIDAGCERIELTSMVRPDVVPQLADAEELVAALPRDSARFRVLVPNRRGAERAARLRIPEAIGLLTASDSYSLKNQRMTTAENVEAMKEVAAVCADAGIELSVIVALAMWCPYDGDTPPERVLGIVDELAELGVREITLATSAGLDGPRRVSELCSAVLDRHPEIALGIHLHEANGMALANALAALDAGATVFESSLLGVGGGIRMPDGFPVNGNVATENLVELFGELEVDLGGLRSARVLAASRAASELLGIEPERIPALAGATKSAVTGP